ncbi:MAG: energy-coupling factor transporter transmembrane protein EcfT [Candidatus Lokiarchaeota archaeon]|nr:energy-coupling factor transporter transmembrane protein EcfT [Candidatus Lokiarchaeota archaeon]
MESLLPFRHENELTFISKIHPIIRFLIPFILIIPFLLIKDIYLTITILFINLILVIVFRLKLRRIFSRIKKIIIFILLLVIFLPLYIGETIIYQFNLGISIKIYREGFELAILLFFRIFTAIFVFMSFFSSLTYSEFIEAITKIRFPSIFVGSLVIFLHYIPILAYSNKRILSAQELRGKRITNYWTKLKTHAFIMAKTLLINMDRSERLYESLKMRGFTGKITFAPRRIKFNDIGILLIFISVVFILVFFINLKDIYIGVVGLFYPLK